MALRGIKVTEFMGLAPGPFCGTILADFGASVTVIQKLKPEPFDVMTNGKKVLPIDLKSEHGFKIAHKLCKESDVIIDTYRPGVMENLGLGPDSLLKENPRIVYARLSGYGQSGLFKNIAGHDINYAAMSGVLSMFMKKDNFPVPPPFISDFAGGSVMCALGILLALFERSKSGKGQVIDCSMTETAAYVATWLFKSRTLPIWSGPPGSNILDGGFPFYGIYKTKDDKLMAVAALEPQFTTQLLKGLELQGDDYGQLSDPKITREKFEQVFLTKTQKEWCNIFENTDACVTPVLDISNVDKHQCHLSRNAFYRNENETLVPEVAPKLTRTPGLSVGKKMLPKHGDQTIEILQDLGYSKSQIDELLKKGCVYASKKSSL